MQKVNKSTRQQDLQTRSLVDLLSCRLYASLILNLRSFYHDLGKMYYLCKIFQISLRV